MIHSKTPSPVYNQQMRKRVTKSGRTTLGSPQTVHLDASTTSKIQTNIDDSDALGFFELLEKEKAQAEMAKILEKQKSYPVAPDAFVPNSSLRSTFQIKAVEPVEIKIFQLRMILPAKSTMDKNELDDPIKRYAVLENFDGTHSAVAQLLNKIDILENLQNRTNKNLNWQNDDDEWVELGDPDESLTDVTSKPSSAKKSKKVRQKSGTLVARQQYDDDLYTDDVDYNIFWDKDTIPDIFKRMQQESWWQQTDENANNNLRSMLLYLVQIIKAKQSESYESACNYVINIFRMYGIEPSISNHIIEILVGHLAEGENDPLNVHTVQTIAQFMIERKDIIIALLDFALKCQPDNTIRLESINAIKFITDVNSSDDIDLVLNNMQVARDASDDTFSLKTIIDRIKYQQKQQPSEVISEEQNTEEVDGDTLHPLLKKISTERWFPRDDNPITIDSIIDAILAKLPTASKSMLKTLTTHLVQLNRQIGYSDEQFNRVSDGIISLLSHNDADYRLVAATVLAELGKETKTVDIALLNSYINDPRVLVRTECCDTLKRLTSLQSDRDLKDCADDIEYLQALPEEDFSLKEYLRKKRHVATPPPLATDENILVPIDQEQENENLSVPIDQEQENENEEEEKLDEENLPITTHEDEYTNSRINEDDEIHRPQSPNEQKGDNISVVHSRSPSPPIEQQPTFHKKFPELQHGSSQFSVTPSLNSSTAPITPVQPQIRVEFTSDKTKFNILPRQHVSKSKKDNSQSQPPVPATSHTPRIRKQPTSTSDNVTRTSSKTNMPQRSSGKRQLLPNNPDMWESYAKQTDIPEENKDDLPPENGNMEEVPMDPTKSILEDHKRQFGYYRWTKNRHVLIPHKISIGDIFSDQTHLTVNRRPSAELKSVTSSSMYFTDYNRNKRHLRDVEFVQLLSSLVIRSVQIHRRSEQFVPGSVLSDMSSVIGFTDALSISQMQLHASTGLYQSSFYLPKKLPPIEPNRPSSAQAHRMKLDALNMATRTGVDIRRAKEMEDSLSNLLKPNRQRIRPTVNQENLSNLTSRREYNEVTHAWILEQLLKSQGTTDSQAHIQQIIRAYPKFTPLLYSRVPEHLISVIWNDPVMKQLASIIGNKQEGSSAPDVPTKSAATKTTVPSFDDEHSSNFFDYAASSQLLAIQQQRDDHKSDSLPPVRGVKMRLPRHVLKFGFRDIESESPEESIVSLRDEATSKPRRRRIYMHLMMSVNEEVCARHEILKCQLRHMLKTDYRSTSFIPFIS